MQNEGSNGVHSSEQDLEKQGNNQEGLSVVGSGDEANQTLPTIVGLITHVWCWCWVPVGGGRLDRKIRVTRSEIFFISAGE
ncbi:hypothetical protein QYF36_003445 [Acer negundo]|nr:hypothetical protein QYF36_003445 [Acer negundo]